jgi:hypothetical protein
MLVTEKVTTTPALNPVPASVSWRWVAAEVLWKLAAKVQWKNPVMFVSI